MIERRATPRRRRSRRAMAFRARVAIAIAAACEPARPHASADSGAAAAVAAAPDLHARPTLPARPTARPAAALHVLRAPTTPRAALEPLPDSLAVELFDARGRPAAGAVVLWRVVAGGGSVSPERTTTDSAGRAAASWTPGATADAQTIAIEAPGAGVVELHATVPAATIVIAPRAPSLWPGDSVVLRASLADAAGHPLAGGAVRWESDDAGVATVSAAGMLAGVGAGSTRVTTYAPNTLASAAVGVTVLPVVAGRVVTVDGAPVARTRVVIRASDAAAPDTILTDAAGRFARRLAAPPTDTVDLFVAAAAGNRPSRLRVRDARELGSLGVVLLPDVWTVTSGTFRGERVPVSVADATARAPDGTRFWRLERLRPLATWAGVGWQQETLPVAVTFPRGRGDVVTAADSEAFWRGARTLERELGMSLFTPATSQPGDEEGARPVIQVVLDGSIRSAGYTFAQWNGEGTVGGAELRIASRALLADETVVVHELMHALGFGHTSSWPTLMTNAAGRADRLTAYDVAYAQLLFRARAAVRAAGAPYALVESAAAEREGGRSAPPARRDAAALPMRRR